MCIQQNLPLWASPQQLEKFLDWSNQLAPKIQDWVKKCYKVWFLRFLSRIVCDDESMTWTMWVWVPPRRQTAQVIATTSYLFFFFSSCCSDCDLRRDEDGNIPCSLALEVFKILHSHTHMRWEQWAYLARLFIVSVFLRLFFKPSLTEQKLSQLYPVAGW